MCLPRLIDHLPLICFLLSSFRHTSLACVSVASSTLDHRVGKGGEHSLSRTEDATDTTVVTMLEGSEEVRDVRPNHGDPLGRIDGRTGAADGGRWLSGGSKAPLDSCSRDLTDSQAGVRFVDRELGDGGYLVGKRHHVDHPGRTGRAVEDE